MTPVFREAPEPAEVRFDLLYPREHDSLTSRSSRSRRMADRSSSSPSFDVQPSRCGCDRWLRRRADRCQAPKARLSVLVAGRPVDRVLRRQQIEADRPRQPGHYESSRMPPTPRGGAWQADGTILFAPNAIRSAVSRAGDRRTAHRRHTCSSRAERSSRSPFILPEGQHFLYYARGTPQVRGVYVARLDGTETKRLLDADAAAVYAPSGHLLFRAAGRVAGAVVRCHAAGAHTVRPFASLTASPSIPAIGLASLSASAIGSDCIRHGQHPSNAVHLVRSVWQAARDRWYAGSRSRGQSLAVARRPPASRSAASSVGTGTSG